MSLQKDYLIVCENFILGQNNLPSLINLIEHISTDQVPVTMPKLSIVGRIITSEKDKTYDVTIKGKFNDKKVYETTHTFNDFVKIKNDDMVGFVVTLVNYSFNGYGKYIFEVYFDERLIGSTSIDIKGKN